MRTPGELRKRTKSAPKPAPIGAALASLAALAVLVSACGGGGGGSGSTTPQTALGDSPTLSGTISNYVNQGFGDEPRVLRAILPVGEEFDDVKVVARGQVTTTGAFTITLPGKATLGPELVGIDTLLGEGCLQGVTVAPAGARASTLGLDVWAEGEVIGVPVMHATGLTSEAGALAVYLFTDTNVTLSGTAGAECYGVPSAGTAIDVKLVPGWNSLVLKGTKSLRNEKPGPELSWLLLGMP